MAFCRDGCKCWILSTHLCVCVIPTPDGDVCGSSGGHAEDWYGEEEDVGGPEAAVEATGPV